MKTTRDLLSLSLFASALVGTEILLNDKWLWSSAPSHAYGLLVFVAIDLILGVSALKRIGVAALAAISIALAQFGAMLADIFTGQPAGVPSIAFRNYLLTDTSYVALLFIQLAILIVSIAVATAPIFQSHRHYQWSGLFHRSGRRSP